MPITTQAAAPGSRSVGLCIAPTKAAAATPPGTTHRAITCSGLRTLSRLCESRTGSTTALGLLLDRRAFHRAIRTKDAAVSGPRFQDSVARHALVEVHARVGRHRFCRRVTTRGARQRARQNDATGVQLGAPARFNRSCTPGAASAAPRVACRLMDPPPPQLHGRSSWRRPGHRRCQLRSRPRYEACVGCGSRRSRQCRQALPDTRARTTTPTGRKRRPASKA